MRRLVLGWKSLGYGERLQARIVNYADDFVILCRKGGEQAWSSPEKVDAASAADVG
jgi:RNA-directed DNA polymerase